MKTNLLLNKLAKRFPKRIGKLYHDHIGLMVNKKPEEVKRIVLVLDMDWDIFDEVKKVKPDLIITHHPFFFGSKGKILKTDERKKTLHDALIDLGISLYSYHTNFDAGKGGMNDALAEALELNNVYGVEEEPCMRIGYLPAPMEIHEFAKYAQKKFGVNYSLLLHYGKDMISKVGIIGGGGSRDYVVAKNENCDIYISGDASHYVRRDMVLDRMNYLDMPHEIEHIFMPQMKKILLSIDPTLEVYTFDHEKIPEVVIS